jgi:hypothetical protein
MEVEWYLLCPQGMGVIVLYKSSFIEVRLGGFGGSNAEGSKLFAQEPRMCIGQHFNQWFIDSNADSKHYKTIND